jgi:polyvinyl alcohol dehydrogenase (cytochrome)
VSVAAQLPARYFRGTLSDDIPVATSDLVDKLQAALLLLAICAAPLAAQDGAALYKTNCSVCHDAGVERAPDRDALRAMTAEQVLAAMESGPMISMAAQLGGPDRRALAEYITGKSFGQSLETTPSRAAMCAADAGALGDPSGPARWNGWGNGVENTRFQDSARAGLRATEIPRLKVKWAFGFPGELNASAQPTIAGGQVFVGSQGGKVYALSAATGCIHWWYAAATGVRTAISVGRIETAAGPRAMVFFSDVRATTYALDATNGALIWKTKVDSQPVARGTGSPVLYEGKLFVPVSSLEEVAAIKADYECCRFRGSVVALDAATGKQIWKAYTIVQEAQRTKRNAKGTQLWGPSGAAIWTSPTVDPMKHALYVTTGDNYSDPPTGSSDAFLAYDLGSGKVLWSRQMLSSDAYTTACRLTDKTNCPESNGPDFDFGSSPILVTLPDGHRALVAGQKSGVVHAIDPDRSGSILWQVRVGKGGDNGGVQWGSAADDANVYVALADVHRIMIPGFVATNLDPKGGGGLFALRLSDGQRAWYAPPSDCGERKRCSPAQSAAVTAIPGIAFSGSLDGHLRAYSTRDGSIVWDFDTMREYNTVNGVAARGGSLDVSGPAIAGGLLVATSGYAVHGGMPGNVLLAFSVDGR